MTTYRAVANDVIQLDPAHCRWGPMLCIVTDVRDWGVQCYALLPEKSAAPSDVQAYDVGGGPGAAKVGCMYLRVEHGHYEWIGSAEWTVGS